jgi:hypothetical protein
LHKAFDELSNFEIVELSTEKGAYELVDMLLIERGIIKVDHPGDEPVLNAPKEEKEHYFYVEDLNYGFKNKDDLTSFINELSKVVKNYEGKIYYCGYDIPKLLSEKSYYFVRSNVRTYDTKESKKEIEDFKDSTAYEIYEKNMQTYNEKLVEYDKYVEIYNEIEIEVYDKSKAAWKWVETYNSYRNTLQNTYKVIEDWNKTAEIVKLNNKNIDLNIFEIVMEDVQKSNGEEAVNNGNS